MQLDRSLAGRFAPLHSPTRERRELRFATVGGDTDDNQGNPLERETGAPEARTPKESESAQGRSIEGTSSDIRKNVLSITANQISVLPEAVIQSASVYRALLKTSDNLKKYPHLAAIVKTLDEWGDPKKGQEPNDAERSQRVTEMLRQPEVVLECLHELQFSIKQYDDANNSIAKIESADPGLVKLIEIYRLENKKLPEERNKTAMIKAERDVWKHLGRTRTHHRFRQDLEATYRKHKIKELPEIDWGKEQDNLQNFIRKVESNLAQRERSAGFAQRALIENSKATSDEKARDQAVAQAKEDAQRLQQTLDVHLQTEAEREKTRLRTTVLEAVGMKNQMEQFAGFADMVDKYVKKLDAILKKVRNEKRKALTDEERTEVLSLQSDPQFAGLLAKENSLFAEKGISFIQLCLDLKARQHTLAEDVPGFEEFNRIYRTEHKNKDGQETNADFATYAEEGLRYLRASASIDLGSNAASEQQRLERWAVKTAERVEAQLSQLGPDNRHREVLQKICDEIGHYRGSSPDDRKKFRETGFDAPRGCVSPMRFTDEIQRTTNTFLTTLENKEMQAINEQESAVIRAKMSGQEQTKENIDRICNETRARIGNAVEQLMPLTKHTVTDLLKIDATLKLKKIKHVQDLQSAVNNAESDPENALHTVFRIQGDLERMETAAALLRGIPPVEFVRLPRGVRGEYVPGDGNDPGKIYINERFLQNPTESKSIEDHEKGHAILDVLRRQSRLFPWLLKNDFEKRRYQKDTSTTENATFEDLFSRIENEQDQLEIGSGDKALRPYKHIFEQREGMTAQQIRDGLYDELYNRYATWKEQCEHVRNETPEDSEERMIADKKISEKYHPVERRLFNMLDESMRDRSADPEEAAKVRKKESYPVPNKELQESIGSFDRQLQPQSANEKGISQRNVDLEDAEGTVGVAPATPALDTSGSIDMREKLLGASQIIGKTKSFCECKEYRADPQIRPFLEVLEVAADDAQDWHDKLQDIFESQEGREKYQPRPEENEQVKAWMSRLDLHCDNMEKYLRELDTTKLDTSDAPQNVPGIMEGIGFWSISDVVKFCKDSWEDIQSIYKRAQDRNIKDTGEIITSALSKIPQVPMLGKYWVGMNAYHKRRYSGTEVEAANKWKEGMENEDSHTLLHYLHHTRNKDAVRGIMTLLCDRGEMEWDNEGVWETLNALGNYTMPIGPCRRDDVLRDTWLRKLISDIWRDKELYYHLKTTNDSKIKSGKSGFTDTADQLSNIGGGMRAELEKQLRMFTQWRHGGEKGTPPEDVKPHLYEEVVEYAIRNGKMTMEDKFYYLIQGVAIGLIGVERLRSLAGEKGGVLMKFPFIDFFYQKNNSIKEIKRFADEIRESGAKGFRPGLKTTLFLYYKVARSDQARIRISKAISRSAEGIDHEDIPFMITQLDYNTIGNLADVISGSRQKVTFEGWKNAYVGFNTFIKSIGELAHLDDVGKARFTKSDANGVAQTMIGYIFMDNILTQNGVDKAGRPTLTQDQLESGCPSGYGRKTIEYRTRMNHFIKHFYEEFESELSGEIEAPNMKGTTDKINFKDFASMIVTPDKLDARNVDADKRERVFRSTAKFSSLIQQLVMGGGFDRFKKFLREYSEKHDGDREFGRDRIAMYNEGSGDMQFTRDQVVKIIDAQRGGGEHAPATAGAAH